MNSVHKVGISSVQNPLPENQPRYVVCYVPAGGGSGNPKSEGRVNLKHELEGN